MLYTFCIFSVALIWRFLANCVFTVLDWQELCPFSPFLGLQMSEILKQGNVIWNCCAHWPSRFLCVLLTSAALPSQRHSCTIMVPGTLVAIAPVCVQAMRELGLLHRQGHLEDGKDQKTQPEFWALRTAPSRSAMDHTVPQTFWKPLPLLALRQGPAGR